MTKKEIAEELFRRGTQAAHDYYESTGDVTFYLLGTKSSFGRGFNERMMWITKVLRDKY